MGQGRARQEQRSALTELQWSERRDWARGVSESNHHAQGPQAIERGHEGVFPDGVVDDSNAFSTSNLLDAGDNVVLPQYQRVAAAVLTRELGFGLAADSADDLRSQRFGPLAQEQTHATGRSMNEDVVAFGDSVSPPDQVMRSQALHQDCCGLLVGHSL